MALVPPGQILFASDAPYGATAMSATWALRHALQVGLDPISYAASWAASWRGCSSGEEPADLGPRRAPERLGRDPLLDRVHTFLTAALGQGFAGVEPAEMLALATLACDVGDDAPQAGVCHWIVTLIEQRASYTLGGPERPPRFAPGLPLLVLAATLARTPDVPLPGPPRRSPRLRLGSSTKNSSRRRVEGHLAVVGHDLAAHRLLHPFMKRSATASWKVRRTFRTRSSSPFFTSVCSTVVRNSSSTVTT